MSNYTKSTNFATKDNLTPGDPLKVVRGTEIDTEFNNIATAVATKTDNASAAITGGTIDGATVGATTPATGSFTTLAASGTTTLAGALVGAATQAAFNTVSTTLNLGGAATAVNLGAATGTATVNNTTLAAKAITASTTLAVTGTSTLTGAVTATAGVSGPITSSSVSITGGSITGITDLAVADGGTGSSTAAGALNNLLPSQTSAANKYLQSDGTNASWDAVSLSTADITGTLGVANGGTGVTTSTGTTNVVLSNSPTLVTPALGTPSAAVLTNATGLPISTGVSGLGTGVATLLATPSSANLASAITDETGSGSLVFATSPTLVTPILGTPTSATLTNATGLPIATGVSGLGSGVATFLATPSSANLAAALTDETGSGANVFATSPTLVTPVLGTPTSATLTNATGLPLTTGVTGTLPTANGGTNLTSFTSGGVVYASSSSALATGSALTFDGTTATTPRLAFGGTTLPSAGTATIFGRSSDNNLYLQSGSGNGINFLDGSQNTMLTLAPTNLVFQISNAEISRFTSRGLGIGTTSVTSKLTIGTDSFTSAASNTTGMYTGANGLVALSDGLILATRTGDARLTVDTSGNLGLGVTPSAWASYKAFQFGPAVADGAIASAGNDSNFATNCYFNSGWKYQSTGYAPVRYVQTSGAHQFYTAPSGTAGNAISFTQALTLTANNDLLIGATSSVAAGALGVQWSKDSNGGYGYIRSNLTATYGHLSFYNPNGLVGQISTNGSATTYATSSDYRLKNITGPITTSGAYIDSLNPVEGTWKADGSTFVGLIAHEVQEASRTPVATGTKDGAEMQAMDYSNSELIANLIAEVKSLRQRLSAANL